MTSIRQATEADVPVIASMGVRFLSDLYAQRLVGDAEAISAFVRMLLEHPMASVLVAESDGALIGMLAGWVYAHPFSGQCVAGELAWWVNPEKRGAGMKLLRQFEGWAREQGAQQLQMVAPNERVGAFYSRVGYTPVETLYQRSLT